MGCFPEKVWVFPATNLIYSSQQIAPPPGACYLHSNKSVLKHFVLKVYLNPWILKFIYEVEAGIIEINLGIR